MRLYLEIIFFSVTLGVSRCVRHEIIASPGEDVVLHCAAFSEPEVQYRMAIWYKATEEPSRLTGLVKRNLTKNKNKVEKYKGVNRKIELMENSNDLLLPNVTTEDSGIFRCFLAAPLGHRNQEGDVHLKVYEHPVVEEIYKNDTIYVVLACTVLVLALLMFCISYICSRNLPQNIKKLSKDVLWKLPHKGKDLIVTLDSKHLICKTLPEVYV